VTRCGDFVPFGRFLEALGSRFSLAYLLLGTFGQISYLQVALFGQHLSSIGAFFHQELGAFSVITAGHTGLIENTLYADRKFSNFPPA